MAKKFDEDFKNYPIQKKLLVSHGSIIALTFILIVALLIGMKIIEGNIVSLFNGPTTSTFYVGDIRFGLTDNQRAINRVIAVGASVIDEEEKNLTENYELMVKAHDIMQETLLSEENKAILAQIWEALEQEEIYRTELVALMDAGDFAGVNEYDEAYYTPLVENIRTLADQLDQNIYAVGQDYCNSSSTTAIILIILGVIMLIAVTAFAVYMAQKSTKSIVDPVKELEVASKSLYAGDMSASKNITYQSEDELGALANSLSGSMDTLKEWVIEISNTLSEIAHGDLSRPFTDISDFRGDFASIKDSFVLILKNFNETLTTITHTIQQVDASSDEIAKSSTELAHGTTEQASAVQELTATVETVAVAAAESYRQTEAAYKVVMKSVEEAEKDREQTQLLQQEMQKIKDISSQIENIIVTIEDIASQTSLLALNASIEAARAGEAGKGFSVVAEQIGKLAQDSADATVNTKELITATIKEIDNGNNITHTTVEAFEKLISELNTFAVQTNAVKEGAMGASAAIKEIENGINQISNVTQQNAAASQESSAVAHELAAKATELDGLIKKFKLF